MKTTETVSARKREGQSQNLKKPNRVPKISLYSPYEMFPWLHSSEVPPADDV